jgi:DNA-binding CsgD family transcriptional regulator
MKSLIIKRALLLTVLLLSILGSIAYPQNKVEGFLSGNMKLDESWSPVIYLSYIPTFNDMYLIANEAIISETKIDSLGNFSFDISFLPENDNLFRLHIVKKGDAQNMLIIGGKDENHMFLLASCNSTIEINSYFGTPPFKNVSFRYSSRNKIFGEITNFVQVADSTIAESSPVKKRFIENQLHEELRYIADTCSNPLISLYAIYNSNFETNYQSNVDFYETFTTKWKNQENGYFEAFRKELPLPNDKSNKGTIILFALVLISISFYFGKWTKKKETDINKLSVQERKVFELLRKGATNQEISEECHIGISTVKSHVSSIFAKLNLKSRKEAMNIE